MAKEIVMPKLGNSVESVIIIDWKKNIGDAIAVGDVICEVETDKATVDVEAEEAGTLLARLYEADDDVPVLVPFAIIGEKGEDISSFTSGAKLSEPVSEASAEKTESIPAPTSQNTPPSTPSQPLSPALALGRPSSTASGEREGISPRARNLASNSGLSGVPAAGSGPGGRIIERDVQAVLEGRSPLSSAAKAAGGIAPATGSGIGGRVLAADMGSASTGAGMGDTAGSPGFIAAQDAVGFPGPVETLPVKGVRKVIATRMRASLAESAQLTLNSSAPASSMLAWRAKYKASPEEWGLSGITLNDLILYSAARLLKKHPDLNASFHGEEIRRYAHVHLGFAVDTAKGLMVPVIRYADRLSLTEISAQAKRLAAACRDGKAGPDDLSGGTFTITNLGSFGIESFTPVINTPEVAILGVNTITNAPVETPDGIGIEKRMGLSLTIDHQAVDGAPGARFLKDLCTLLGNLEWAVAL